MAMTYACKEAILVNLVKTSRFLQSFVILRALTFAQKIKCFMRERNMSIIILCHVVIAHGNIVLSKVGTQDNTANMMISKFL